MLLTGAHLVRHRRRGVHLHHGNHLRGVLLTISRQPRAGGRNSAVGVVAVGLVLLELGCLRRVLELIHRRNTAGIVRSGIGRGGRE